MNKVAQFLAADGIIFLAVIFISNAAPRGLIIQTLVLSWISLTLFFLWLLKRTHRSVNRQSRLVRREIWRRILFTPVATAALAAALEGWMLLLGGGIYKFYAWTQNPTTEKTTAAMISVPIAFLAGALLFALRLKYRSVYGLLELGVAGLVAVAQVQSVTANNPFNGPAFLTAAVYLVVRGLDNVHQGLIAAKPDPLIEWALRRLKARGTKPESNT